MRVTLIVRTLSGASRAARGVLAPSTVAATSREARCQSQPAEGAMPAIPMSVERLFKQAGRAEQARLRRERREAEEEARERARQRRRQQRARTQAPAAAHAVWEWLKGPQAAALRAGLRAAHANSLMVLGWLDEQGQQHDDAYYHRWQVLLVARPGTLRVHRIGSQAGGGVSKESPAPAPSWSAHRRLSSRSSVPSRAASCSGPYDARCGSGWHPISSPAW